MCWISELEPLPSVEICAMTFWCGWWIQFCKALSINLEDQVLLSRFWVYRNGRVTLASTLIIVKSARRGRLGHTYAASMQSLSFAEFYGKSWLAGMASKWLQWLQWGVTFSQVVWLIGCWLVSASHKLIHKLRKKKKKSIVLLRKEIINKLVVDLLQ